MPLVELYTDQTAQTVRSAIFKGLYLANRLGYECKKPVPLGGGGTPPRLGDEGSWPLCLDFWNSSLSPSCTVFSFGINNDFSFDDDCYDKFGCKIYSFDPSMQMVTQARAKSEFLQEGLFGKPGNTLTSQDGSRVHNWKVDTLKGYMERFEVKTLNYLKIDIEYSEWSALRTAIDDGSLANVDQLGIEIHFWWRANQKNPDLTQLDEMHKWNAVLEDLHLIGFRMWYTHTNPESSKENNFHVGMVIPCCFEMVYVRVPQQ